MLTQHMYALHGRTDRVFVGVRLCTPAGEQRQCVRVGSVDQLLRQPVEALYVDAAGDVSVPPLPDGPGVAGGGSLCRHHVPPGRPACGDEAGAEETLDCLDHRDRHLTEHPEAATAVEAAPRGESGGQSHGAGRFIPTAAGIRTSLIEDHPIHRLLFAATRHTDMSNPTTTAVIAALRAAAHDGHSTNLPPT
ncbi:hypothetical protein AB0E04_47260 [Streptomyces sp. NPDC048251]|uniref:hypothetical protein n=1 Tax=Streptomyces sp. NPDC048251 TaxID=3154501 RepID=UPI00343E2CF2